MSSQGVGQGEVDPADEPLGIPRFPADAIVGRRRPQRFNRPFDRRAWRQRRVARQLILCLRTGQKPSCLVDNRFRITRPEIRLFQPLGDRVADLVAGLGALQFLFRGFLFPLESLGRFGPLGQFPGADRALAGQDAVGERGLGGAIEMAEK
jgi:hypothetical protein